MGCGASAPAAAPAPAGPASAEGSSAEVAALPQETAAAAPAVSSLKSNSFMRSAFRAPLPAEAITTAQQPHTAVRRRSAKGERGAGARGLG
jgi:hypothetical protein